MISKELLSEVLKINVISVEIEDNGIHICAYRDGVHTEFTCNIYELAHKCKSWALDKNQSLTSWAFKTDNAFCEIGSREDSDYSFFEANTEQEAIFKACEWILKGMK